ncbi:MAG: hypothetical protein ABI266_06010 [Ginsengibacter sp.]
MKIIYIAGDGRSGSTILDSVLGNIEGSISVGECARFWKRFQEKDTLCGCGDKIEACLLWSKVDEVLKSNFVNYDITDVISKVNYIRQFNNYKNIPSIVSNTEWKEFCEIIILFYRTIAKVAGKEIIIDSSKYPNWIYFLSELNFCEIKIIHLERNLQSVANSWKKIVYLPEYYDKQVLMPIKSNYVILKSWIKVKYLSSKLKKNSDYLFINYEDFCHNTPLYLKKLESFLGIIFKLELIMPFNHSIGGNPVRSSHSKIIKITDVKDSLKNLNTFEKFYFPLLNNAMKRIIS